MARNNWARDAFRRAQNLMSRGYSDFEPTSVVTKDDLNNLKTVLLSDEQIARSNEQQPDQWYQFPDENEQWAADAVDLAGPVEPKTTPYGKEFNLDTIEQDMIDYEEKNAIRNRDPDRPQSAWDKWAAPDELTETQYKKKQSYLAIQAIENQIKDTKYGYFTKMTPGEKEKRDARIKELTLERNRLMEIYRARDWAQDTPNEKARKAYKEGEQYVIDNAPAAKELGRQLVEGTKIAWDDHKHLLNQLPQHGDGPNRDIVSDLEEGTGLIYDKGKEIVTNIQDKVIPGIKKDWDKTLDWIDSIQPLQSFTDKMKSSESSGDYEIVNDRGYIGAYQFGDARLEDYQTATGSTFTKEEFLANKELQDEVFEWHVDDIKKYMSRTGLDSWVGEKILGVEVTLEGLIAVAHLGGKDGLRQFLESDGEYNPSDGKTTLRDYLIKFGGKSN